MFLPQRCSADASVRTRIPIVMFDVPRKQKQAIFPMYFLRTTAFLQKLSILCGSTIEVEDCSVDQGSGDLLHLSIITISDAQAKREGDCLDDNKEEEGRRGKKIMHTIRRATRQLLNIIINLLFLIIQQHNNNNNNNKKKKKGRREEREKKKKKEEITQRRRRIKTTPRTRIGQVITCPGNTTTEMRRARQRQDLTVVRCGY